MSQYQSSQARYVQSILVFCNEEEIAVQLANLPEDLRTPEMALQLRLTNAEENQRKHDLECARQLEIVLNGARVQPVHEFKEPVPGYVSDHNRPERKERERKDQTVYQRPEREQQQIEGYQTPPRRTRVEVPPAPRKQVVWADRTPNQLVSAARYLDFNQPTNPAGDAAWGRILAQRHQKLSDAFRARARQ